MIRDNLSKQALILASRSKRRAQILRDCGFKFKVAASNIKEKFHHTIHPRHLVAQNSKNKAAAVAKRISSGLVLGADTLVWCNKRPIGKPQDMKEARCLLELFSGRRIAVYTGLCLIDTAKGKQARCVVKTTLEVKKISPGKINNYLKILGPYDKAGGFSIEGPGAILFDNLRGSYFNVLGLPMRELAGLFDKLGLDILDFAGYPRR